VDISPDNTIFIVLSFEGPDIYSMAGGLGSRITNLNSTLVKMGFQVHHFFIGAPGMEGLETREDGRLLLHRWCQWISKHHPGGVYDGEEAKLHDFNSSVPPFVVNEIAIPAISSGKLVAILGEEWHTAQAMSSISDLLYYSGVRPRALMFWNANNTYGFNRIDWPRLSFTTTITTVSKYMRQIMLGMGINPLIIPNGIPGSLLDSVDTKDLSILRDIMHADIALCKVARWHPDKGWEPAFRAIDILKRSGIRAVLLGRGGVDAYGMKIARRPELAGISVIDVKLAGNQEQYYRLAALESNFKPYFEAIDRAGAGDVINLLFPVPPSFLRVMYRASDVVLANSMHEPFGLVGLEAMAAGAVVFCGCTGEDYATHMYNSIVLDTHEESEINFYVDYLQRHPERKEEIGRAARKTAEQWTWEEVVKRLICKLEYQARVQGIDLPSGAAASEAARE
jgi:glycosyltransferase involved in cell wall biosynthesis